MIKAVLASLVVVFAGTASARPAVVVELYTSEACSSCPPAEALLGALARDPDIVPLAFHVDYWNGPSWRDPFATPAATERQRALAAHAGSAEIYTPEMDVDGGPGFVGSDEAAARAAIAAAPPPAASASLERDGGMLIARVGAGTGAGVLRLYGTDRRVPRRIGGGENAGAGLVEYAVIRSAASIGAWHGEPVTVRVAAPAGEDAALVVEASDGRVLAASRLAAAR